MKSTQQTWREAEKSIQDKPVRAVTDQRCKMKYIKLKLGSIITIK